VDILVVRTSGRTLARVAAQIPEFHGLDSWVHIQHDKLGGLEQGEPEPSHL
jgi:hypothetical protein